MVKGKGSIFFFIFFISDLTIKIINRQNIFFFKKKVLTKFYTFVKRPNLSIVISICDY